MHLFSLAIAVTVLTQAPAPRGTRGSDPATGPEVTLYEYDDGSGPQQVERLEDVPKRYRAKAKAVTAVRVEGPARADPIAPSSGLTLPSRAPAQSPGPQQASDEAAWRSRFQAARQRFSDLEANVRQAQATVARLDGAVGSGRKVLTEVGVERYERALAVLREAEAARKAANDALHELERQAANAAVPFEWRR